MNERKWMIEMIWRLMNWNKLIRFFISLFHFYHLLKNAESRIDKSKGKVCFIYKKFGQNWSKITTIFLCFNKKFLKSLNLVNADVCFDEKHISTKKSENTNDLNSKNKFAQREKYLLFFSFDSFFVVFLLLMKSSINA